MSDPCLACTLPDCDDTAKGCMIRVRERAYWQKVHGGRVAEVTDDERDASNAKFQLWHQERLALAAEGVRPYNRSGSPWKGGPFLG